MKLKNMMAVLDNQNINGIIDPSKYEQEILKQVEERKNNHLMKNQLNKLTPKEKWQKKQAWIQEDVQLNSTELVVSVFIVQDIQTPKRRGVTLKYKLDVNAQKFGVKGIVILFEPCIECKEKTPKLKFNKQSKSCACLADVVIFETGVKRSIKMKKLMERIKWSKIPLPKEDEDDEEVKAESMENNSKFMWTGLVNKEKQIFQTQVENLYFLSCQDEDDFRNKAGNKFILLDYWNASQQVKEKV
eukprot:snap_masked-scaffold_18-processed-gene-6.46-mRNA-1 protein AED:1.00 eAED:1.00 QI:0/-1/0/0/-1/1/1/0/243